MNRQPGYINAPYWMPQHAIHTHLNDQMERMQSNVNKFMAILTNQAFSNKAVSRDRELKHTACSKTASQSGEYEFYKQI